MIDPFIKKIINNRLINVKDYIINHYVELGLEEVEAMLLIHIYNSSEQGIQFLSINSLKEKMAIDFVRCADLVLKLVNLKMLAFDIVVGNNGKTKEKFTLEPLYQKIVKDLMQENNKIIQDNNENEASELANLIESEFGRTLSAFEIQIITSWIESSFDLQLIKFALKEAVLSRAYNLKYVDRILLTWKQNNITSVEQALEYTKTFKRYEAPKNSVSSKNEEVYVSWMK